MSAITVRLQRLRRRLSSDWERWLFWSVFVLCAAILLSWFRDGPDTARVAHPRGRRRFRSVLCRGALPLRPLPADVGAGRQRTFSFIGKARRSRYRTDVAGPGDAEGGDGNGPSDVGVPPGDTADPPKDGLTDPRSGAPPRAAGGSRDRMAVAVRGVVTTHTGDRVAFLDLADDTARGTSRVLHRQGEMCAGDLRLEHVGPDGVRIATPEGQRKHIPMGQTRNLSKE